MNRSDHLERTNLSTRALEFLIDLQDFDASQDELIGTFCVLAEELQPGAIVGGAIIDGARPHLTGLCFPACQPRPSSRLLKPDCPALRRNVRTGGV